MLDEFLYAHVDVVEVGRDELSVDHYARSRPPSLAPISCVLVCAVVLEGIIPDAAVDEIHRTLADFLVLRIRVVEKPREIFPEKHAALAVVDHASDTVM